jgi:Arf-GAP with coiled-coil, ANK repeat and PH domain-containing protein
VTALSIVESKKRFEFLEAVSGTMDAHLRYFKQVIFSLYNHRLKFYLHFSWFTLNLATHFNSLFIDGFGQGYELLHQMEPYIQQVRHFLFLYVPTRQKDDWYLKLT